jgi:hypothetical protein
MLLPRHIRRQLSVLQARLEHTRHPWSRALAWVLRTRLILVCPLPRSISGFTIPLLPLILLSPRLVRSIPASTEVQPTPGSPLADPALCNFLHILLHEAAHQLWAVWPEWQRWLGRRRIYGVDINAADAVSEMVCRELCAYTRYAGQDITYRSPLRWLHAVFGR